MALKRNASTHLRLPAPDGHCDLSSTVVHNGNVSLRQLRSGLMRTNASQQALITHNLYILYIAWLRQQHLILVRSTNR